MKTEQRESTTPLSRQISAHPIAVVFVEELSKGSQVEPDTYHQLTLLGDRAAQ